MTVKATKSVPEAKSGIASIKPHMVVGAADAVAKISIALDSNENAFGPSPKAHAAALAATEHLERYLENPARILVPALASCYGLEEDRIAIGFGSDDLLARIARAYLQPGTALLRSQNSYLKVPNYAYGNDADAVAAPDRDFCTDVDAMLSCLTAETRIVYLANPDNPSGAMLPGTELRRLHAGLPRNVLLVIDGAYSEYVTDPAYEDGEALVQAHDNVVVTRSFSKIHGLAFCLGNGFIEFSSPFSIIIISPFSTSLMKVAPTISKAQVSEAKMYEPFNLPITNGLIPIGSLTPTNFLFVIITKEYPPCIWNNVSISLSKNFSLFDFANN